MIIKSKTVGNCIIYQISERDKDFDEDVELKKTIIISPKGKKWTVAEINVESFDYHKNPPKFGIKVKEVTFKEVEKIKMEMFVEGI